MRKLSLTTCEAEVMNVVWAQKAVTVQDVVDAIPRPLAYTTVMTTMKILEDKGFIERGEKRGRAYVYRPLVSCESASRNTVSEMANRFFDGSVVAAIVHHEDVELWKLTMHEAVVSSMSFSDGEGANPAICSFSLSYRRGEFEAEPQSATGQAGGAVVAMYDLSAPGTS